MALSDYMTDDEWNACFYLHLGGGNLGETMRTFVRDMLATGYRFAGLGDAGEKARQVPSSNAHKMRWLLCGGATWAEVRNVMERGRNFIKAHLPYLLSETDDEWREQLADADRRKEENDE